MLMLALPYQLMKEIATIDGECYSISLTEMHVSRNLLRLWLIVVDLPIDFLLCSSFQFGAKD